MNATLDRFDESSSSIVAPYMSRAYEAAAYSLPARMSLQCRTMSPTMRAKRAHGRPEINLPFRRFAARDN